MFETLINSIIQILQNNTALNDFIFMSSFTRQLKPNPISQITVCVGMGSSKITNTAFGDFLGNSGSYEYFGKKSIFNAKLLIYAPTHLGGVACCQAFSKIANTLMFSNSTIPVLSLECKEVKYDKVSDAFLLECNASCLLMLGQKSEDSTISGIVVKEVIK